MGIFNKVWKLIKYIFFYLRKFGTKKTVYFLLSFTHSNVGDLAITISEKKILQNCNIKYKEITDEEFKFYHRIIPFICKNRVVIIHGGGYFGNVWLAGFNMLNTAVLTIKAKKFILFPQTIYYTDDDVGKLALEKARELFSNRKDMLFFVRDRKSYNIAKDNFGTTKICLVPDVVLYNKPDKNRIKNNSNGLLVFRHDKEKQINNSIISKIKDTLSILNIDFDETDMFADRKATIKNRLIIVSNKLNEFRRYSFIITDRLHGMIFAYLTKTPCLVFRNNSHKILGQFEWIRNCNYIFFHENDNNLEDEIYKLIHFDFSSLIESSSLDFSPMINELSSK